MNVTLYGLKNCDTCRKALKEIEGDGHNVTLIDVREDDMDPGLLAGLWPNMATTFYSIENQQHGANYLKMIRAKRLTHSCRNIHLS